MVGLGSGLIHFPYAGYQKSVSPVQSAGHSTVFLHYSFEYTVRAIVCIVGNDQSKFNGCNTQTDLNLNHATWSLSRQLVGACVSRPCLNATRWLSITDCFPNSAIQRLKQFEKIDVDRIKILIAACYYFLIFMCNRFRQQCFVELVLSQTPSNPEIWNPSFPAETGQRGFSRKSVEWLENVQTPVPKVGLFWIGRRGKPTSPG